MAYHQRPSRPYRFVALLALTALAILLLAGVINGFRKELDRPVVRYDLSIAGKKVCTQVETSKGVMSCESFSKKGLDSFEWQPALSLPE